MNSFVSKDALYLGKDSDGEKYYLALPSWDCGWYWGFGYVQSKHSHQHADGDFNSPNNQHSDKNIFTSDFLVEKSFDEKQSWILRELMATFYQYRAQAELVGRGGMHVTSNPLKALILDTKEAERINKVIIPTITEAITIILKAGK